MTAAFTVPLDLAVAQWVLLLTLGLLVIVAYRQLGHALNPSDAVEELAGPALMSTGASFEYRRVGDETLHHLTPGDGNAKLLAFVDPTCPSCESLVEALGEADEAGELASLSVLLLLVTDPPSYLEISDAFRNTTLEIGQMTTAATVEAYKPSATPLLVGLDGGGIIRSVGPATKVSDVRVFSKACLAQIVQAPITVVQAGGSNGVQSN